MISLQNVENVVFARSSVCGWGFSCCWIIISHSIKSLFFRKLCCISFAADLLINYFAMRQNNTNIAYLMPKHNCHDLASRQMYIKFCGWCRSLVTLDHLTLEWSSASTSSHRLLFPLALCVSPVKLMQQIAKHSNTLAFLAERIIRWNAGNTFP
jgi:hypothetical protein